ncbi:MBL fold metallo-hydrolase [Nocardia transvalensis]|uniref:MBL fold metallo-hydrolase n=1 Tax=Nocardia transvalensis TaxID=37333 RepID=UPI0018941272|nr:MBL fold metallo-hydrolase [Nocardia transvalensis]MBF6328260.1 MBL fold metallo-hydrolase [Nocardia transvalensis]
MTSFDFEPTLTEVADGVFAYVQPDGGWCLNNAGILVSEGEVALIDTAATQARAARLRQAAARLAPTSPRIVLNTHFHGDHTFGNQLFPEAVIIGHEQTRLEMLTAGLHLTQLWPDVSWGALTLTPPQLTYRDRMTLHLGELTAEIIHVGPAHTTDDTVVWLADQRVLFTGDVVLSGVTPFCLMGSVSGTLDTVAMLRTLGAETVVTGHGAVRGPEVFDETERYMRWLQHIASDAIESGITPLEAARTIDLGEFSDLIDPERLVPNLHRAYAEHAGAAPGDYLDIGKLFAEMIEHHGGLPLCHA